MKGGRIAPSEMNWGIILAFAFGVLCVGLGILVRTGRNRTFYALYQTSAPPMVRNRPFALIPAGVALMAGAGVVSFHGRSDAPGFIPLFLITVIGMILSIAWLFKPPRFLKPRWLLDVESGVAPQEAPPVPLGAPGPGGARRLYMPAPAYWGLWALTATVVVLWIVLDWSTGVLVGVGAAISTLAVMTPNR